LIFTPFSRSWALVNDTRAKTFTHTCLGTCALSAKTIIWPWTTPTFVRAKGLPTSPQSLKYLVENTGSHDGAHLAFCHAVEVLKRAIAKYGTPNIVNVGQGTQFTDSEFTVD
jgi:hypothetical protein